MAKDIDLSSKEWTDLVFEGRNKEYGAYYLRSTSTGRHNRAFIYSIIGAAVLAGLFVAWSVYSNYRQQKAEEEAAALLAQLDQQQFIAELDETEEEEIIEENQMQQEEEIPEALPEEILNTEKFTEFLIVDNEQEIEEVKTVDEIKETETAIGNVNFDQGTDDLNVDRTYKEEVIVEEKTVKEEIFQSVEQMPQFPGGEAALLQWIASHIKYPTMAMENGVQGRVIVRFVVTRDGSIGEVQVARGKDPDLDKEAVRVVKSLPKFTPGRMNGQPVSVWYTLPINFKLQGM